MRTPSQNTLHGWSRSAPRFGFYAPQRLGFFGQAPAPAALRYPEVNTALPALGPGYYAYYPSGRPDNPPDYHRYGIPEVIRAVRAIAAEWQRLHPQGPRLGFGDISLMGGGPTPRHGGQTGGHQRGLEADIRPLRSDGREVPATYTDPNYSRTLTQELVNVIHANPILRVRVVFFNDPAVSGVKPLAGHDNHLHVGFYPSAPAQRGSTPSQTSRTRNGPARVAPGRISPEIIRRTNEIFFARHPERGGRPILPGERQLTAEWIGIRNQLLQGRAPR